jgi:hypothetical protein
MNKVVRNKNLAYVGVGVVVALAGIATGWLLAGGRNMPKTSSTQTPVVNSTKAIKTTSTEAGVSDDSTFKDTAEGTLVDGGLDGDGMFHLERPGGASQNVYLTSTVIDLASFKGKKVQVWGQTMSGKKAGWLMDVGKIKVIQ